MTTTTHATGTAGLMRIDDDGNLYVDFYIQGINQAIPQLPWAYIIDGQTSSWRSFNLAANTAWQKVTSLPVSTSQTITFKLGPTGNAVLGGPTDFPLDVIRASDANVAFIPVDGVYRRAIPYVRDGGVWKQVQPWGKLAGEWKPAAS